jgi:hypothetical protein
MLVHSSNPLQQQQRGRHTSRHIEQRALRQLVGNVEQTHVYQTTKETDRTQLEVTASCLQLTILFKCKINPSEDPTAENALTQPPPLPRPCHLDRHIQQTLGRRPGHDTTQPIQSRLPHLLVPAAAGCSYKPSDGLNGVPRPSHCSANMHLPNRGARSISETERAAPRPIALH